MKAAFFDGKNLKLNDDYPKPKNQTLVKVDLAGICGTDLEILDGYMQYTGVLGHEYIAYIHLIFQDRWIYAIYWCSWSRVCRNCS